MLRRKTLRYRKKSLVVLAIICISSSTLYKVCLIGEKFYEKHYLVPELREFERKHVQQSVRRSLAVHQHTNTSQRTINNLLTTSRIKHQLKQDNLNCSDTLCTNLLTPSERSAYESCTSSASGTWKGPTDPHNCVFLNGADRRPIGLASFPGSGNTWVRGLLQKVTEFCTGSVYCDRDLRQNGFPGEGVMGGSVLIIKTHKLHPYAFPSNDPSCNCSFDKVIFIIRDPYKAIISEWNRRLHWVARKEQVDKQASSHVLSAGNASFGNNPGWVSHVTSHTKRWFKMVNYWLIKWGTTHRLHVAKYEDIVINSSSELSKMLRFMGVHIEEDNIRDKLQDGYSSYHRKSNGNFTHFTADQVTRINAYLNHTHYRFTTLGVASKYNLSLNDYVKQTPV